MKIVWCNGVFDIIHASHIELFKTAKMLAGEGGRVVVGIDSDRKVRESKGPGRPINNAVDRRSVLESIRYIDVVYEFKTKEELENLILMVSPAIMLLGGDYRHEQVVGRQYCKDVRFLDRRTHSTSNIIRKCGNES